MKIIIFLLMLFIFVFETAAQYKDFVQYIFPIPGSKFVSIETTLIVRFHDRWKNHLNPSSLKINVKGEHSGIHAGKIILTNNQETFIYKPHERFSPNEKVYVEITSDLPGFNQPFQYYFFTSALEKYNHEITKTNNDVLTIEKDPTQINTYGETTLINGVSLPSDFPKINIDIFGETAPGKLFLCNYFGPHYAIILENDGTPYFYQRLDKHSFDFKLQPTGTLTRWDRVIEQFIEIDSNYTHIDQLHSGSGYYTDLHELQLLINGNYILIGRDEQYIDMSQIVPGGDPHARVIGNHVLEMDRENNVLFEWRSWDHLNITDAVHLDLTARTIDYVHINAVAIDYDNHILISSRCLSEIIKINRQTGDIIWRLGGENNQFQFINDADGISWQHDIRPVPGKPNHYTLFDNGNFHSPQYSRAVEFELDTLEMQAMKVWEYSPSPDWYSYRMGNVQYLPNGNYLINWATNDLPIAMEVTPEGNVVFEMKFLEPLECYRTFRFEWDGIAKVPYLIVEPHSDKIILIFNKFGDSNVSEYRIYGGQNPKSDQILAKSTEPFVYLTDLENNQTYFFRVTAVDSTGIESGYSNEEEVFIKFIEPGENLIINPDFSQGSEYWELDISENAFAQGIVEDNLYWVQIDSGGIQYSDVQLRQENLEIVENRKYVIEFDAWSSESKLFDLRVRKSSEPFTDYSKIGTIYSTAQRQHHKYEFSMENITDYSAQIVFECGQSVADLFIDNISLYNLLETNIVGRERLPKKYRLYSNYPNPFNPTTIINYELPITNDVELSIFNLLGQKMVTLVSEKQKAGHHQVVWDASGFSSGVYYYRIEAGEFQDVKKMILIK